jgi:hypothetical protein
MTLHVVNTEQWLPEAVRKRFTVRITNGESTDQTGTASHSNGVKLRWVNSCFCDGFVCKRSDCFDVCSSGDFRNNASESGMFFDLARKNRTPNFQPFENGHAGLVTARLDSQNYWSAHDLSRCSVE